VLTWLLGEPNGEAVRKILSSAEIVAASHLTLIEADRVVIRAQTAGQLSETQAADCRSQLNRVSACWIVFHIDEEIVERARRPFPIEPIRTLDAIHLATASVARSVVPGLTLLSLARRIRACGEALGFQVLPESTPR
jgi:predicted nucleic acid-binding protein